MNETRLNFAEIIDQADIPELTAVMTRTFDDDSRKHFGTEHGGPEGYDNGDFFRKWLFGHKETIGWKALIGGQIVAAAIVWVLQDGNNFLGTIFVDPAYQDRGIGTRFWQFLETSYPQTKAWNLETPSVAIKNHFFYEKKCGFTKVGETDDCYVYRKVMG